MNLDTLVSYWYYNTSCEYSWFFKYCHTIFGSTFAEFINVLVLPVFEPNALNFPLYCYEVSLLQFYYNIFKLYLV